MASTTEDESLKQTIENLQKIQLQVNSQKDVLAKDLLKEQQENHQQKEKNKELQTQLNKVQQDRETGKKNRRFNQ